MVLFPPCDVTAESIMSIYPPAKADSTSGRCMFEPATPATKMQETRSEVRVKWRKLSGLQTKIAGVISYRNNAREGSSMGVESFLLLYNTYG